MEETLLDETPKDAAVSEADTVSAIADAEEKTITEEDLKENPGLVEAGIEVGDEVLMVGEATAEEVAKLTESEVPNE